MRDDNSGRSRVVVAHRFPLVVEGLAIALRRADFAVDARCTDGQAARVAIHTHHPDIAVLGLELSQPSGLDLLREHRSMAPRIVLLCDNLDPPPVRAAVGLGVGGLLLATAPIETVGACVAAVAGGERWHDPAVTEALDGDATDVGEAPALTPRERDVARLVVAGQRNRSIADELGISEGTVKMHLHRVYAKFGIESRTQLATDARARAA